MVSMPLVIALIVCKTVSGGPDDMNAGYTGSVNRDWDLSGGVFHCRRIEMQVISKAESEGQPSPPWTPEACMRSAMMLGPQWDQQHRGSAYRFWRVACPTKVIDLGPDGLPGTPDDSIIGWKIPECPYMDGKVLCEQDSVI